MLSTEEYLASLVFPCPLCGAKNQSHAPGGCDICKICGWEDYGLEDDDFHKSKQRWQNGETLFEKYPNPKRKTKAA